MSAASVFMDWLAGKLPTFEVQFGRWEDRGGIAQSYVVIKPEGGVQAELIRRPQWSVMLIGPVNGDRLALNDQADALVEAMRSDSAGLVFVQPAEPVFMAASDGRPIFDIAVEAITT